MCMEKIYIHICKRYMCMWKYVLDEDKWRKIKQTGGVLEIYTCLINW